MSRSIDEDIIEIINQQRRRLSRIEEMARNIETRRIHAYRNFRMPQDRVNKSLVFLVASLFFILLVWNQNLGLLALFVVMGLAIIQLIRERTNFGRR